MCVWPCVVTTQGEEQGEGQYSCSFCVVYRETANIPLIALGLKETKEVDFSAPFKVQKNMLFSFPSRYSKMCFIISHDISISSEALEKRDTPWKNGLKQFLTVI